MKRWTISYFLTGHAWRSVEIEAETKEEAKARFTNDDYDPDYVWEGDEEWDQTHIDSITETKETE